MFFELSSSSSASIIANSDQLHHVEPAVVAVAHGRPERLLRDHFRQDQVLVGLRRARGAHSDHARHVGGVDVAAPGEVGVQHLFQLFDDHRLEFHLVSAEVVGEVQFGGGAGLHADRRAVELLCAHDFQLLRHHEALAVVVVHADEIRPRLVSRVTVHVVFAREHVHFARLERGETLLRGERRVADLAGVAKNGGRTRAADVDVDGPSTALRIGLREAGQSDVDPTLHESFLDDRIQGRLCMRGTGEDGGGKDGKAGIS